MVVTHLVYVKNEFNQSSKIRIRVKFGRSIKFELDLKIEKICIFKIELDQFGYLLIKNA